MKIKELFPDVVSENKEYEYKATLNEVNPLKWAKTLIAFANNGGGYMFVGVSDNGEAFGIDIDEVDKTKNLIAIVNDRHIFPHVKLSYSLQSVDKMAEKYVLLVHVYSSDSIVRYKDGDFNETVYIKGDGYTTKASPEDIVSLGKRKYGVDNSITDIKYSEEEWKEYLSLCKEYRQDGSIPSIKELKNQEIINAEDYVKSGFLMFKDDYDNDDSLLCCRLWVGKDKAGKVLDKARFKGPLPKIFEYALDFIERNTKTGWEKTENGGRREIRSYPKLAVREALVNAIAHRDYSIAGTQIDVDIYSDRLDITSPGSWLLPKPYGDYLIDDVPSIRRNTIISACLDVANLMERGGTGFKTMSTAYKDYDQSKQPSVISYPGFLVLRLYDVLYDNSLIDNEMSNEDKVIEMLKSGPKKLKELQQVTNYKSRSTFLKNVIKPLLDKNIIERNGNPKSPSATLKLK